MRSFVPSPRSPFRPRRALLRAVATVVLAVQTAPVAASAVGGLAHGTFHFVESTRDALERQRRSWAEGHRLAHAAADPAAPAPSHAAHSHSHDHHPRAVPRAAAPAAETHTHAVPGAVAPEAGTETHAHAPGARPHAHSPAVDALLAAADDGDHDVGPVAPGPLQVDDHVPPAAPHRAPAPTGSPLAAAPAPTPAVPDDPGTPTPPPRA